MEIAYYLCFLLITIPFCRTTYDRYCCAIIGTLVNEIVIYPFARNKLPSILRCIGAASFLIIALRVVSVVLQSTVLCVMFCDLQFPVITF